MSIVRLILSIVVVAVFLCLFEMVFHGKLLKDIYEATPESWRTLPESEARMGWMFLAYFLMSTGFCLIWAMGFGSHGPKCGAIYGFTVWLIGIGGQLLGYVFQPVPEKVMGYWAVGGLIEMLLAGVLVALVYKPKANAVE